MYHKNTNCFIHSPFQLSTKANKPINGLDILQDTTRFNRHACTAAIWLLALLHTMYR